MAERADSQAILKKMRNEDPNRCFVLKEFMNFLTKESLKEGLTPVVIIIDEEMTNEEVEMTYYEKALKAGFSEEEAWKVARKWMKEDKELLSQVRNDSELGLKSN